ncbi:MAG: hypothetical protein KKB51_00025 [Candidatus Riflebacteria bacterium]|nr:hypothetical protein [Candidatus Riflebacteria bacterium]
MMQTRKYLFLILVLIGTMTFIGCFGGDSKDSSPVAPSSYVTLNGTLTAPDEIESSLLGSKNTDSEVRSKFKTAGIYVNGALISTFELLDMQSNADWPLKIENVPESATGKYIIDVVAGHITLKSRVRVIEMSEFRINLETTAAAMLAEATGREQNELLATYSAFVNSLKNALVAAAKKTVTVLAAGSIVKDSAVLAVLADQKKQLDTIADLSTTAKFAYLKPATGTLQLGNDLDGDGKYDLYVKPNSSGERVNFYTALSNNTSMRETVTSLDAYSDAALLADFADPAQLSQIRTFGPGAPQTILGFYFKKSATGDQYLKMYIHRIDIVEGDCAGVLVEYSFVATATTAISKGQKTLMHKDSALIEGAVYATNFLTDSDESAGMLSFISTESGIGSTDGTRMVLVMQAKPIIDEFTSVPEWLNGGNYYPNTSKSLTSELFSTRTLETGDVFAAYFPATKHYALFKINSIGSDRIVVDYIVNASEDERRFK